MRAQRTVSHIGLAISALVLAGCGSAGEDTAEGPEQEVVDDAAAQYDEGTTMRSLAEAGTMRVGVSVDRPGLGFLRAGEDVPAGFDVEIAKLIAAELGIADEDVEWVDAPSGNREVFLQEGTTDMVVAAYSMTPERAEVVSFAGPYYVTGQQLLVRQDSDIEGPEDVRGRDVCATSGSTPIQLIEEEYGANPRGFDQTAECRDQVLDGSVDAMTTDGSILLGYAAEHPDDLEVVGEPFSEERYGVGIPHGDTEFCEFITDTLESAIEAGTWAEAFDATLGQGGGDTPEPPEFDRCA